MIDPPQGEPQLLPGLEEPERATGHVERAARRTIAALEADDLLEERDALLCQALLTLSRQYDRAASSSRAKDYAIANLHAQLLSTLDALPRREEGDDDDEWSKLEREFAAAAATARAEAAARDAAQSEPTD